MSIDQPAPTTIDAYIAAFPADTQAIFEQIRRAIHEAVPDLKETISYGIPAFTLSGKHLVYIGAYKKYIGLYPAPMGIEEFQEAVSVYGAGKGTLKFPLGQPIPFDLIRNIVQFRAQEHAAKAAAKGKKK